MPDLRHRWLLVDLGGFRRALHCACCDSWRHRWGCFGETGETDCICGLDRARSRPAAPADAEAVA